MHRISTFLLFAAVVPAQGVVPLHVGNGEGASAYSPVWATSRSRCQILIDPVHLGAWLNRDVRGISFRRDGGTAQALDAGSCDVVVKISHAPHAADQAVESFTANHAAGGATTVFQGRVAIPASAAVGPRRADWNDPQDVIDLSLQSAFRYTGGTLCIDLDGAPVPGNETKYWPIDGVVDTAEGTVVSIGPSCALFGGRQDFTGTYVTASTTPSELVPGCTAGFRAEGSPNASAALLIGFTPASIDLATLGIGAPGCTLRVLDAFALPTILTPLPIPGAGGTTEVRFQVPRGQNFFGASFRAQFVEIGTPFRTSNALQCTFASRPPSLGLAVVRGRTVNGQPTATGEVDTTRAPIVRLR